MKKNIMKVAGALTALALFVMPVVVGAETLTRQLQLGMSGSDVTALQTYLAKDNTIYPQGLITGYFGSLTKSAVSNFQARNGIDNIGRVGPVTMALLNNLMNGMAGSDSTAPWFNSINVSAGSNTANISWNTNENASAIVYYSNSPISMMEGTTVTIGGSSQLVSTSLNSSHSTTLTSLSSNTNYYYVLYVRDGSGNESVTWPAMFHTN
jgi:peptidoglycan hydrolase-like protein with peptidoglycan-binding domain